ncbi:MAG: GntP family permease [Lachnospiraceae bacterium]|jgi:GntP family gluconate:H+ symporter/Gnt-I system low-affinity gluconate transporter|nr:gluconate permease [Lachnospiraceae bacterium]MCI9589705.1 gluconate permease [Lachnospiraceae bacterium]MDE6929862.1 GntP family permease [Lachnospiraceae bacterium]
MDAVALNPTRLVIAAIVGLIILLVLIIKFNIQAMIAILIGALAIGLMAGMPFEQIVTAVNDGIGNTLKGIALLVGLGSMFGAILETSGGAQSIAVTMVKKFGDEKAAWALGITGLVIAMPVFFDAGLIILIPLAFSLAKRTRRSSLFYVIPLLAGLAVGHAFIPPTPGPVLVATMLNVELGWVILVGIFCGTVAMIVAGPVWGAICGKKFNIAIPEHLANQEDFDESKLPKFGTIVGIILIPLVLIILDSIAGVVPAMASIQPILGFLGEPFVALLIATVVAMFILGYKHGYTNKELENVMTKSLEPTGMILLVTASGGVLRYMLQYSGLGDVIGNAVSSAALPMVVVAFVVAALVRISVGSATVAMTMAAGIIAAMPGIADFSPLYLACITAAVAGGSTVCSHFNDSGFWLVKSLVGMDEKTTLKTWTIMETLVGGTGFLVALIISFFA